MIKADRCKASVGCSIFLVGEGRLVVDGDCHPIGQTDGALRLMVQPKPMQRWSGQSEERKRIRWSEISNTTSAPYSDRLICWSGADCSSISRTLFPSTEISAYACGPCKCSMIKKIPSIKRAMPAKESRRMRSCFFMQNSPICKMLSSLYKKTAKASRENRRKKSSSGGLFDERGFMRLRSTDHAGCSKRKQQPVCRNRSA